MVPSLESICGVPVVVVISNHPEVKKQIFSSSTVKLFKNKDEQKRWENAINKQVSEILKDFNPVLKSIFPRLRVKFIGIEMLKWTENLQTCFDLPLKFSQDFIKSSFFTSHGFIDEDKAARELVKEQSLSLLLRYKIACHFYFQDIVPNLWQELQNNEPNFRKILSELSSDSPMVMWSDYLLERKSTVQNHLFITSKFKGKIFSCGIKNKNVAAVKFSFDSEGEFSKNERKRKRKLLQRSLHKCACWIIRTFPIKLNFNLLLKKKTVTYYNFINYFLITKNAKTVLLEKEFASAMLSKFLYWPFQHKFMKIAQICFETMYEDKYQFLLDDIILHIRKENMNSSYNYRLLLREFWIESPTPLKEYVINREAGEYLKVPNKKRQKFYLFLIEMLFHIRPFTMDDMQNVNLIVKYASPVKKAKIFQIQGEIVCSHLCSLGNYERANFFFNVLELDQDTIKAFKKDFAFDFFLCIIKRKSIECIGDEFFKWILESDEIDELKDEIFYTLTHTNDIAYLFKSFPRENKFLLVDKILKLFLKTDDKIKEWKKNISLNVADLYSPTIRNNPHWFDNLLVYLNISEDKASDIKRDLLFRNLPKIAKCIFLQQIFKKNILFLCLYKKKRIRNFTQILRVYYQYSITHKVCLLCMNNSLVSGDGNDTELQCEDHGTRGFISPNNVDVICSSFFKCINKTPKKHRKKPINMRRNGSISWNS